MKILLRLILVIIVIISLINTIGWWTILFLFLGNIAISKNDDMDDDDDDYEDSLYQESYA